MPEYLSPGVYVEEFDSGAVPMEAVSTSTAGFIGMAMRGPVIGKPQLVTSFADYQRTYGGYLSEAKYGDKRFLPYAVGSSSSTAAPAPSSCASRPRTPSPRRLPPAG